jgi:hypothetical protein
MGVHPDVTSPPHGPRQSGMAYLPHQGQLSPRRSPVRAGWTSSTAAYEMEYL